MDLRRSRLPVPYKGAVQTPAPTAYSYAHASGGRGAKLHIGCGVKRLAGWINADGVTGVGDVVMDLQSDFQQQAYSEIYGSHVLEHVWPEDTPGILKRLFEALQPGGTLRLSVPDIRLVLKNCIDGHAYGDERSALAVIHGGSFSKNTAAPDLHRQTFWKERLERLLAEAGFTNIREWGRGQYRAIDMLKDFATFPFDSTTGKSLISLNLEADRPGELPKRDKSEHGIDVSVILGTVDRGEMFRNCVESVRRSLSDLKYEIVVAYGRDNETNLPWMRQQDDIVPISGGMNGAIEAFNKAYDASRGRYVCQINDDVLVDGDSIVRAVNHLDQVEESAGVIFKFDRGDGKGYRHESVASALHPNQMVVRRETCEAVVERIGAFWGDAAHRTDKTYGGDTAFGVVCKHLGLRLDSVEGVTCRDLLADDTLRASNAAAVGEDHRVNWREMFTPYMTTVVQPKADEWPNLYVPRAGMAPRRSPIDAGRPLRLLHMSLRSEEEPQTDMRRALSKIGPTFELPWFRSVSRPALNGTQYSEILSAAKAHKPDVVFAQVQGRWPLDLFKKLRTAVGADCTLVQWTGDVRTNNEQPAAEWLQDFGRHFDIVLADGCAYPRKLKFDNKVEAACGYLSCGIDPILNPWRPNEHEEGNAVFLGGKYTVAHFGENDRESILTEVVRQVPLSIYGPGWETTPLAPYMNLFVNQERASLIMRRAPLTISTSLFNDMPRYTSDRLKRAMASGAVVAVRRFPDMVGLGLREGENCLGWSTPDDLVSLIRSWTRPKMLSRREQIRRNAAALAHERFTWDRSVEELLAIVRDFRTRKGLR